VRIEEFEGQRVPAGFDRRAADTTDRALRWLERTRDPERPFFLFVHYFDPHDPYVPPRAFAERFALEEEPGSRGRAIALYDAEVAYTDAQLGRLLVFLDERGLSEETLVVVTADHGEGLFDHGYLYHDVHLYEEAVRVPLVMRRPGLIPAGRSFAEPVALVDLLPTLLDLLGLDAAPAGAQGLSLAPALLGRGRLDPGRPVFLERRRFETRQVGGIAVAGEKFALREGSWKYIEAPEEGTRELFHLGRDAQERENLVERESGYAAALAHQLRAWREATPGAAPGPAPSPEDRRRLKALGYVE
jgi:arylsulfatase A-like enzyme